MFTPLKKLIRKSASGKNIKYQGSRTQHNLIVFFVNRGLDIATNEEAPKPPPAPPLSPSIATTSTVSLASSMAPSVTASSPTVGKRRDSLINSMFASSAKRTISLEPLPEPDEPKTEVKRSTCCIYVVNLFCADVDEFVIASHPREQSRRRKDRHVDRGCLIPGPRRGRGLVGGVQLECRCRHGQGQSTTQARRRG